MTAPSEQALSVTVVVPTHRRPDGLRSLLSGLAIQQADFPWDVLIVENHPPDQEQTRQLAAAVPGWPVGIPIAVTVEQTPGAASARNRGIAEASGDVIAMLDDDVVPQPGWLASIVAPIVGGATGSGGVVVLDPTVARPAWWDESGLGGYLTAHDLGDEARDLEPPEILVTANAAARREALLRIGGFDVDLGPRNGRQLVADDAALTRALRASGGRLSWAPAAVVVHDLPASRLRVPWLLKRAWWQGRSDWLLERRDHADRKLGGARVAVTQTGHWWRHEWRTRRSEGLRRRSTQLHVACDVARVAGTCWQAFTGMLAS